ncbi:MAG: fibronectin type III domain-containing protein, partial [Acidimicrobiales bacterium]
YVANYGSGTVSVIDGASDTVTATVTVGSEPDAVGVDPPTDTVYVANYGSDTVSVVDGASDAVTATVTVGLSPEGVGVDPATDTVYVANFDSGTVSVIDGQVSPAAPVVQSSSAGNGEISLSWSVPSSGALPVLSYLVTVAPASGQAVVVAVPASQLSATVGGLGNGRRYKVSVTADDSVGAGTPSAGVSLTPAGPPSAPIVVSAVPGNARAVVSWTAAVANGAPISSYAVTSYAGSVAKAAVKVSASKTSTVFKGLTNGTAYSFVVTAKNRVGTSGPSYPSAPVTPATVPSAPASPKASIGNGKVTVSWAKPASDGGSGVTAYEIYEATTSGHEGANPVNAYDLRASTRSYVVTGLKNGTKYYFVVKAVNALGTGAASKQVSARPT